MDLEEESIVVIRENMLDLFLGSISSMTMLIGDGDDF